MELTIAIDTLVLEGFAPAARDAIAEALRGELARLLAAGELPRAVRRPGLTPRIDAGAIELPAGAAPAAIGVAVARAVYAGMGPAARAPRPTPPRAEAAPPQPSAPAGQAGPDGGPALAPLGGAGPAVQET